MKKIRIIHIDPEEAYKFARLYQKAAAAISTEIINSNSPSLIGPIIVNSALATEMYLKCLLSLENSGACPTGHELKNLYRALTLDSKAQIEKYYSARLAYLKSSNVYPTGIVKVNGVEQTISIWDHAKTELQDVLEEANEAFVNWRYGYENDSKVKLQPCTFLEELRLAIRQRIEELKPEWLLVAHR
ncbi:MAG TPA: hypothetical protein VGB73_04730 [Pyrinomonadaceae bacterium]|jgi:hypothetical protein